MSFNLVYGNVFDFKADAFVMPANPKPIIGSGLDQYVYKVAGRNRLLNARQNIGELKYGEVGVTPAFDFAAKYIIHAASPRWIDDKHEERKLLVECYRGAINEAINRKCSSIVFPLLSSGKQSFPYDVAVDIAKSICNEFAEQIDIILVIYSDRIEKAKNPFTGVSQYIYEHTYDNIEYVRRAYEENKNLWGALPPEREERQNLEAMLRQIKNYEREQRFEHDFQKYQRQLDFEDDMVLEDRPLGFNVSFSYINQKYKTPIRFGDVLEKYIIEKGFKNHSDLCKKAGISKEKLSRVINNRRTISRDLVWTLAITLGLNKSETEYLFKVAGIQMYTSQGLSKTQIEREKVLQYCIDERFKDIDEVNFLLDKFGMESLYGEESK